MFVSQTVCLQVTYLSFFKLVCFSLLLVLHATIWLHHLKGTYTQQKNYTFFFFCSISKLRIIVYHWWWIFTANPMPAEICTYTSRSAIPGKAWRDGRVWTLSEWLFVCLFLTHGTECERWQRIWAYSKDESTVNSVKKTWKPGLIHLTAAFFHIELKTFANKR